MEDEAQTMPTPVDEEVVVVNPEKLTVSDHVNKANDELQKALSLMQENPCPVAGNPEPEAPVDNPNFYPPGNWTPEGTQAFYEKHNRSFAEMVKTLKKWPDLDNPKAFAAQVKDYCEGHTEWRGKREPKKNPDLSEIALVNPEPATAAEHKVLDFPKSRTVKNPQKWTDKEVDHASEIYENFIGEWPDNIEYLVIKGRTVLIELARADSLTYEAAKHGKELQHYMHRFEGEAVLYWDMANQALVIMGKDIEITEAGIEG